MSTGKPKPAAQVVTVKPVQAFISPLHFRRYAAEFLDAAPGNRRREFSPVPYFLCCRAIELALKGFLLAKGASRSEIKTKLGHNLEAVAKRAHELGLGKVFSFSPKQTRALELANSYYQSKGFEYFSLRDHVMMHSLRLGRSLPDLTTLRGLALALVAAVERPCLEAPCPGDAASPGKRKKRGK